MSWWRKGAEEVELSGEQERHGAHNNKYSRHNRAGVEGDPQQDKGVHGEGEDGGEVGAKISIVS